MGLKFSGTNYEDQNGIEKYIKDGTIIMSSELESTIAFMDEKHSEEFIKKVQRSGRSGTAVCYLRGTEYSTVKTIYQKSL